MWNFGQGRLFKDILSICRHCQHPTATPALKPSCTQTPAVRPKEHSAKMVLEKGNGGCERVKVKSWNSCQLPGMPSRSQEARKKCQTKYTNEIALQTSTVKSLALWQSKVSVYKYAGSRLKYLSLLPSALNVYIYIYT